MVIMKLKYLICLVIILLTFILGFFWGKNPKLTPSYYHANNVGSQIIEVNQLYSELIKYDEKYILDMQNYNRNMLLIIDCTWWISEIKFDLKEMKHFMIGIKMAFENTGDKKVLRCNNEIDEFIKKTHMVNYLDNLMTR